MTSVSEMSVDEWASLHRRAPAPTFSAQPAWALALHDAYGYYVPAPLWCHGDDGARYAVPLVASRGKLPWRVYSGMPLDTYTLALGEDGRPAPPAVAAAAFTYLLAHAGQSVDLTPWPQCGFDATSVPGASVHARETSLVDLSDGAEAALARMDGKARRMAGQADRRGVTCAPSHDANVVDEYYDMLLESAKRWGREKPTIPKRLLEALAVHGGADFEIWLAMYEGSAIAGGAVFYGSQELTFWSAAMRAEFGTLRPSNALNVALIHAAAARGLRWYDLGSSEGLPGVKRFKEGLGAVDVPYCTLRRESTAYRAVRAIRNLLGRRGRGVRTPVE